MSILNYFERVPSTRSEPKLEESKCVSDIIKTHIAFTDGSCFDNGTKKAIGGIGVFFEDDSLENISNALILDNDVVTNNKCELEAVRQAILVIVNRKDFQYDDFIKIYSDSKYLIDSITKWSNTWAKNGWTRKNKKGKKVAVKNVELIKEIRHLHLKYNIELIHCKAHTTFKGDKNSPEYKIWYGNKMADELAVKGTTMNKK